MDEWKVVLAAMADVKRDAPLQLMQRVMTLDMALKALGAAWNRRAEQQVPEGWLRAVDEAMVCSHLGIAGANDDYESAKKKLNALICWNIAVATDPAVNGGYKLVPTEPTKEMIEQGAMGMASFQENSVWPDSWEPVQVKGMRMDAKKAYHYMLNAAPEVKK